MGTAVIAERGVLAGRPGIADPDQAIFGIPGDLPRSDAERLQVGSSASDDPTLSPRDHNIRSARCSARPRWLTQYQAGIDDLVLSAVAGAVKSYILLKVTGLSDSIIFIV